MTLREACCAAVLLFVAKPACADLLKDRLVSEARQAGPDNFVTMRTLTIEQRVGRKIERHVSVEQFDPRRPPAERWTLLTQDGRAPTDEEQQKFREQRNRDPVPSYARIAVYLFGEAERGTDAAGRTVYRVAKLPRGSLDAFGSDISDSIAAEATVNTSGSVPFVERLRLMSTKAARIKLIARMERLESISHYRISEIGKPVLVSQATELAGSLLFRHGTVSARADYTSHQPLGRSGPELNPRLHPESKVVGN